MSMTKVSRASARKEIDDKFAVGSTEDYVNLTIKEPHGATSTKIISKAAAVELAIQILQAAQ